MGRQKLPYVDLKNFKGLFTKSSVEVLSAEQLRVAENCDFFKKYGAVAKIAGSKRILNSIYKESNAVKPISWVGFYKSPDLAGVIQRHVLVAAGTTLNRLESDGSLTQLESGRTSGLFHDSDRFEKFMLITNVDPAKVGSGDELIKYDGAVTTQWGLTPPGGEQTVHESFDDASDWTATNCTVSDESDTTWDGAATRIDKTGTSARRFSIERQHDTAFNGVSDDGRDSSKAPPNRVRFFTFIPRGSLTASNTNPNGIFAQSGPAMSVKVSPDVATVDNNNWEFYFRLGNLLEGWNILSLDFSGEAPEGNETGQFYPQVQDVARTQFNFNLVDESTTVSGIRMDRYHCLDAGAPVANATGSGSLTGVYSYKVTYVSKYAHESNAGPQSRNITASSNSQINLTNIPTSSDPQVVSRRIYRTVANGSIWLFLAEIFDNTTTTYTDTTPDGSLGNETPPQAADFSDDNSRPPKAGIVTKWKRTVFMAGDPQNPETLYFSEDDEPESFPLINAFKLDAPITAIYQSYSILVVETETAKWQVIGDNPDFSVDKIVEDMGCVGRRAAGTARIAGYAVDRDGMRLFDGSTTNKISEPIRDKYDTGLNKENIELIHTVHSRRRNAILQFNPDANKKYTSIFSYNYAIDNVESGYWSEIVTPSAANLNFLHAEEIEDSNGDFHIYVGGDDGMLYEILADGEKNWVDANGNKYAIVMKLRTPYLREGELGVETEGVTGRIEPRWVELRTDSDDATTWKITIETANGPTQTKARDSRVLNMEFGTNNAMIRQSVDGTLTAADYFRVIIEHNEEDVATILDAIRIYFHVQEGQYEIIDVDNDTT